MSTPQAGSAPPPPGALLLDTYRRREVRVGRAEVVGRMLRLELFDGATALEPIAVRLDSWQQRFTPLRAPHPPYSADAELVRQVAEAARLAHAYLFDPFFASETSLIDLLPHQFSAVYDAMLPQERLRFLLADDAGAGKTIMTGLYIRHQLLRGAMERVLVVAPAGLVGNWKNELWRFFHLRFEILEGADLARANPFADGSRSERAIISVDTAARERAHALLTAPDALPYDLVVFDEAHKLAAGRDGAGIFKAGLRYRLACDLGRRTRHLLLLTATPHMGKDEPYAALWRLLDADLFAAPEAVWRLGPEDQNRYILRRLKEQMVNLEGKPLYRRRTSTTAAYAFTPGPEGERALYDAVTAYCESNYAYAGTKNRQAARLAMMVLQRRLASSSWALLSSLRAREERLGLQLAELENGRVTAERLADAQTLLPMWDVRGDKTGDEEEADADGEEAERVDLEAQAATAADTVEERRFELSEVSRLRLLAERVYEQEDESKFRRLEAALAAYPDTKVLIFTEYRATADFLVKRLSGIGYGGRVARIDGTMPWPEREVQVERFRTDARFLVATDAAGEGINLQFCWLVVNYDVPWNPARLEQRLGRVHRYGQEHDVAALSLVAEESREGRVLEVLLDKLEVMRERLGDRVYDVIGDLFRDAPLPDLIARAVFGGDEDGVKAEVESRLERAGAAVDARRGGRVVVTGQTHLADLLRERQRVAEGDRVSPAFVAGLFAYAARAQALDLSADPRALGHFSFVQPSEAIVRALEAYPGATRDRLTFDRALALATDEPGVYIHPGEPVYDSVVRPFVGRSLPLAEPGAVFVDAEAEAPYVFALVGQVALGTGDSASRRSAPEVAAEAMTGVGWDPRRGFRMLPAHWLLTLDPADRVGPAGAAALPDLRMDDERLRVWLADHVTGPLLETTREERRERARRLGPRLIAAFRLYESDLLELRLRLIEARSRGEPLAETRLHDCDRELDQLDERRRARVETLASEIDGLSLGPMTVWARALVLPKVADDPDLPFAESERIAMSVALAAEERDGARVRVVDPPNMPATARRGYDLESVRPNGSERWIEVKGRSGRQPVDLSPHEWSMAINHRDRYWLYVVRDCKTRPRLVRIPDPFGVLVPQGIGGVRIDAAQLASFPEEDWS